MSSSTEETDPGVKAKLDAATKKMDPWADDLAKRAAASAYTPWFLIGAALLLIGFGAWVAW